MVHTMSHFAHLMRPSNGLGMSRPRSNSYSHGFGAPYGAVMLKGTTAHRPTRPFSLDETTMANLFLIISGILNPGSYWHTRTSPGLGSNLSISIIYGADPDNA